MNNKIEKIYSLGESLKDYIRFSIKTLFYSLLFSGYIGLLLILQIENNTPSEIIKAFAENDGMESLSYGLLYTVVPLQLFIICLIYWVIKIFKKPLEKEYVKKIIKVISFIIIFSFIFLCLLWIVWKLKNMM